MSLVPQPANWKECPAQFPHRKGLNFSPHNFRTTPTAPHNPAQDFLPNIAHKCEIVIANQVVVSYRDGSLIASVGNYEQQRKHRKPTYCRFESSLAHHFYEGSGEFECQRHRNDTENAGSRNRQHAIPKTHPIPGPSPRHDLRQDESLPGLPAGLARDGQAPDGAFPNLQPNKRRADALVKELAQGSQVTALSAKLGDCGSRRTSRAAIR